MARVLIATQAWGVVQNPRGDSLSGITVELDDLEDNAAEVFTTEAGSTPATLTTNSRGEIPGWVDTGSYDLTVAAVTRRVEATSGEETPVYLYSEDGTRRARLNADGTGFVFETVGDPPGGLPDVPGLSNWTEASAGSWAASRDSRDVDYARIAFFGDSLVQGMVSTVPFYANGYVGRLRNLLSADAPNDGGTGIEIPRFFAGSDALENDPRYVKAGTWTVIGVGALMSSGMYSDNSSSATVSFGPVTCDSFTVYFAKDGGLNPFTVSVDGGTAISVPASAGGWTYAKVDVPAGAMGAHTITVAGASSGRTYFLGVEANRGTTGYRVDRIGIGGKKSNDLATVGGTGFNGWPRTVTVPDLAVVSMGINDYLLQSSVASLTTNFQTAITGLLASGSDVLMLIQPPPQNPSLTVPWTSYTAAMQTVATNNDLPVLDLTVDWVDYATSSSRYSDAVHPNDIGHARIAELLYDTVTRPVS